MNRREFLASAGKGVLGAGAVMAGASVLSSCVSAVKKPNIIFILADDLGYGDLGCYGQSKIKTPCLDTMAKEGMRFTQHYAGSTVCAPSRASLMTGLHTGHCRVRGNYETGPHGFGACLELRPEDKTVAEYLKEAGYATSGFGKWGMGVEGTTGEPPEKGFDEWYGFLNQAEAHYYYPETIYRNGRTVPVPENENGKQGLYIHDALTDEAMKYIEAHQAEPFFMYLAYTIPHAELLVPEEAMEAYAGQFDEPKPYQNKGGWGRFPGYGSQSKPRTAFAAMISRMDRDVGRLIALLKTLHIDENTLIVFSSDNGPHHEAGADPDFFQSAGPLRGMKRDLYEGGIRVPMIARWPGTIQAGSDSDHISAFWDFLPTACEAAGLTAPDDMDGISYLPALKGGVQPEHDYLYWEFHENSATDQALRKGRWKAVRHNPNGPVELYDMESDISESRNIADEHPGKVKEMEALFEKARTSHEIWPLKG